MFAIAGGILLAIFLLLILIGLAGLVRDAFRFLRMLGDNLLLVPFLLLAVLYVGWQLYIRIVAPF